MAPPHPSPTIGMVVWLEWDEVAPPYERRNLPFGRRHIYPLLPSAPSYYLEVSEIRQNTSPVRLHSHAPEYVSGYTSPSLPEATPLAFLSLPLFRLSPSLGLL
ncbi:hypothetical protein AYI69_g10956 [Smittium culicis]|uniref:Uncharacterized protein n=1 Tax=Smittium culicis TaxID=133412 RepID=A0A1R1X2A3_9FUNG|nr:hypothetical protein AYI69_g10956 [Smittium culicis]